MAESIARGRAEFLRQFPSLAAPEMRQQLANPGMRATFERCQLDFDDRRRQAASYQMHRDLIWLRRRDAVFARQSAMVDGARLTDDALMLRFFGGGQGDRLILVNFGATLDFRSAPQPLLAPPEKGAWRLLWSSEHPDYGGAGTPEVITKQGWHLPGESAVVLTSSESGSA
jgi:maltooligosyltrehalose trehalohydrolase